jgi:hypothetical protein
MYSLNIDHPRIHIVDPSANLLLLNEEIYLLSKNGIPLYYDENHLTKDGALLSFLPLLERFYNSDLKK